MLRLGTRRSELAQAQANAVADALRADGHEVELVWIRTHGDRSSAPLDQIGGTGVFTSALRDALVQRDVDVAVHSYKDLPTAPHPQLEVVAVPLREDPRDVLITRDGSTLAELPAGSVVGTGSPRRVAQLAALGLGLAFTSIRGNVGTRIDKLRAGEVDALVLARAGLNRLSREDEATETLDPQQMLPAPGQGALALECRTGVGPDAQHDEAVVEAVTRLDDAESHLVVSAERRVLSALDAGCTTPVGALAEIVDTEDGQQLWLRMALGVEAVEGPVGVDTAAGVRRLSAVGGTDEPERVADRLVAELLGRESA